MGARGLVAGAQVRTVEGLADGEALNDIQQAFSDCHGLQCGFCTPGYLMTLGALARAATVSGQLLDALGGVVCRCTRGYVGFCGRRGRRRARHGPAG